MPKRTPCRVLFLCRHNRMRSPTAERIFSKRHDLDVRSAGTAPDALARVNAQMLDWADLIFIMDGVSDAPWPAASPDTRRSNG